MNLQENQQQETIMFKEKLHKLKDDLTVSMIQALNNLEIVECLQKDSDVLERLFKAQFVIDLNKVGSNSIQIELHFPDDEINTRSCGYVYENGRYEKVCPSGRLLFVVDSHSE